MGYTTDFHGQFAVNPPLKPEQVAYLKKFNETRRMRRDPAIAVTMDDPVRLAVGLPIGDEGGYFVGGLGFAGQDRDPSCLDSENEPTGQPSLWCQWVPTDDGKAIEWDEGEKFYHYDEWLQYLIDHFIKPWGGVVSGEVEWKGEDDEDRGKIVVSDNVITTKQGRVVYDD